MGTTHVGSVTTLGAATALVLIFGLSTPVLAAMWMQISINPATPTAGESVSVTVLTFSAMQNLCWDDPRITSIPEATWYSGGDTPISLDLEMVVLNSSHRFTVPLRQRQINGDYWDGTIIFPSGGEWQLYAMRAGASANPTSADRCVGTVRTVAVQPLGPATSPKTGGPTALAHSAGFSEVFLIIGAIVLVVVAVAELGTVAILRLRR
jgi:hypothetical protein